MATHHLLFTKTTQRNVSPSKIDAQLNMMLAKAHHKMVVYGINVVDTQNTVTGNVGSYQFDVSFTMKCHGLDNESLKVKEIMMEMLSVGQVHGWSLNKMFEDEGSAESHGKNEILTISPMDVPLVDGDTNLGDAACFFSHLFERNAQISVVLSAVAAARATKFSHRFHTVLEGPPGSGKTEVTNGIAKMVGEDGVIRFDGPSCTKAGLENYFLRGDDISGPKIMIFEEIEKTEPDALKILLGILDTRAEVRKTTGNDGQMSVGVQVLCVATVNNVDLFKRLHAGALASRFTHKVFCPRPSRKCLENILLREVHAASGKAEWINPALDYTLDVEHNTDPRRSIAVCLSGRDQLLDGSYQRALRHTQHVAR